MKRRIQIDSALLSFFIILTGFLYQFPKFYFQSINVDDLMDFVGLLFILKGTFLRMVSRGYKMAHSQKSRELVTGGPYAYTRNPMYLGSFLMGVGFVLLVWPWWSLPVFAGLFYMRFRPQILAEEKILAENFPQAYERFAAKVPRMFPKIDGWLKMDFRKTFPQDVLWTTKEKWGLVAWPVVAAVLESLQEKLVYGFTDLHHTMFLAVMAGIVFALSAVVMYRYV